MSTSLAEERERERAGVGASRAFVSCLHVLISVSLSFPLGVSSWLRLVIAALPGLFY